MPLGSWPATTKPEFHSIRWPSGPDNSIVTSRAFFGLGVCGDEATVKGHIWFINSALGQGKYLFEEDFELPQDTSKTWDCPPNIDLISVRIDKATQEVSYSLELLPQ